MYERLNGDREKPVKTSVCTSGESFTYAVKVSVVIQIVIIAGFFPFFFHRLPSFKHMLSKITLSIFPSHFATFLVEFEQIKSGCCFPLRVKLL